MAHRGGRLAVRASSSGAEWSAAGSPADGVTKSAAGGDGGPGTGQEEGWALSSSGQERRRHTHGLL